MNRAPNRLKCQTPGCDAWLEARLVNSARINLTTWIFRKTAALITCPNCDATADPDNFSMHEELRNRRLPPGPSPHNPAV